MKGVERNCKKSFNRALELFERSLELINQNTDQRINRWYIKNHIAQVYLSLGQTEKALDAFKANNVAGMNDAQIGRTLACEMKRPDEALPFLSDALVRNISELITIAGGYTNAYYEKSDYSSVVEINKWLAAVIGGLNNSRRTTYLDKIIVQLILTTAVAYAKQNNEAAVREYLAMAKTTALKFDLSPSYNFKDIKFFAGNTDATAFDDFGETAMLGITQYLNEEDDTKDMLNRIWDSL